MFDLCPGSPILKGMGYESLSAVVVLVIVVIVMAGWLPVRTAKGMRKVAEHREDKYSPSLHLIGMDGGTRFSDEHTPRAKGIIMQSDPKYTAERVAHVRRLRRAAIRRRRVLALSLLAVCALVFVVSFPLHFSPLFALIPGVLLVVVLVLGVRASAQARAWEHKVAMARRKAAKAPATSVVVETSSRGSAHPVSDAHTAVGDAPATDVMEQQEIRRALEQARREQAAAFAQREAQRNATRAAAAASSPVDASVRETVQEREDTVRAGEGADTSKKAAGAADVSSVDGPSRDFAAAGTVVVASQSVVSADSQALTATGTGEIADETSELERVSPTRALDAFDMASSSPDLISFSLGAPRNGDDTTAQAPESREIRSAKQVAKAVPVERNTTEHAGADTVDAQPTGDKAKDVVAERDVHIPPSETRPASEEDDGAQAHDRIVRTAATVVNDNVAFHSVEEHVEIDAPQATSDSLGTGLEAILARRSA